MQQCIPDAFAVLAAVLACAAATATGWRARPARAAGTLYSYGLNAEARGSARDRSWSSAIVAAADEVELVRDVDELAASRLVVSQLDPPGQGVTVDLGMLLQLLIDGVNDVMKEVFFVGAVASKGRMHDPVGRARTDDSRAGLGEMREKMPARPAVAR